MPHWLTNFLSGLRLVTFTQVSRQDFRASLGFMVFALLLSVGVFALIDYWQLEHIRFQDIRGSALLGLFFGLGLLAALICAHLEGDYPQLPVLLTVLLSGLPIVAVLISLFPFDWCLRQNASWPLLLLLLYLCAVIVRALRIAFYYPRALTLLAAPVLLVAVSSYSWAQYYFPSVFDYYNPDALETGPVVDVEHTLYRQRALVEEQLKQVARSEPGNTDFFFLGFGGSDRQTVFESETQYAKNVAERLFGTDRRAVTLYNNVAQLDTQAIANTYNLEHALQGIARRMNVDEDVLLLVLTSHGGEDATLAIELEDVPLKTLDADALSTMLDDANIQWRILIISACYSGSFIDALENEQTLLITAASADRNSFGCSSERELTVFGEALFQRALSDDTNLVEAFAHARELIRQWETEADLPMSKPQIRVGHQLRLKLGLPLPPAPESAAAQDPD